MADSNRLTDDVRDVGEPGSAARQLLRLTRADYEDGIAEPRTGVNAAEIAQTLFAQNGEDIPNDLGLNQLWVTWGQFLDHDITLTPEGDTEIIPVEGLIAPIHRSIYDDDTGTDAANPREQVNVITPLIDASNVYGSDGARLAALRSFEGGRLKTSEGKNGIDFLPLNHGGLANAGDTDPDHPMFVAGDVRANENVALTAMHTVFVNEHNYWADRLADKHPDWSDEAVFQAARSIIETLNQKITYDAYLPHLIGADALPDLADSPDGIDPGITTEFSTAAFRFAHSMVTPTLTRIEEDGTPSAAGDLSLQDAFFDNGAINEWGIASLLCGISETTAQELDTKMIDDLNFFLAGPDGTVGFSLAALNIMRGRDHGLPSYLEVRAELLQDIDPDTLDLTDFSVITSDTQVQAQLGAVYGTVDQVDLWVGGLAEDQVEGAIVGPLFQSILAEQFTRLRDADAQWYERRTWLDDDLFEEIQDTTLSDILMRSGGVEYMQRDAFLASERIGGDDGRDCLVGDGGRDLIIGFGGRDTLFGRGGDDDLFGGKGKDLLLGGSGSDGLNGGNGRDTLLGGRGDDELWGGKGRDLLHGGAGDDLFVFKKTDGGRDRIADFDQGEDLIVMKGFGAEFDDLRIKAHWNDTVTLSLDGKVIVKVAGDFDTLDMSDFLFIA